MEEQKVEKAPTKLLSPRGCPFERVATSFQIVEENNIFVLCNGHGHARITSRMPASFPLAFHLRAKEKLFNCPRHKTFALDAGLAEKKQYLI